MPSRPPQRLSFAVACVASAMLLVELMTTRIFSVLFLHHFSFFAISLVMSGLVVGGILAARWNVRDLDESAFRGRLSWLAAGFAALMLAAFASLVAVPVNFEPNLSNVALRAAIFLPGLVCAGAFLAAAFARRESWIGTLYAWDLLAASGACLGALWIMRTVQGPSMLLCPVAVAAVGGFLLSDRARTPAMLNAVLVVLAMAGVVVDFTPAARFLRLKIELKERVEYERWNEHSRIQVLDIRPTLPQFEIFIDRLATTSVLEVPSVAEFRRNDPARRFGGHPQYVGYRIGRPLNEVAIIGVGGGMDVLAAVSHGARHVDGYELNAITLDLLKNRLSSFNAVASFPEVSLIHSEARVGIAHSGKKYDVIQASLIDTWAATASGGFVLSENSLYTVEGWKIFLDHLNDGGILTMTRWYVAGSPSETQRLVALASQALSNAGIKDVKSRIALVLAPMNFVGGNSKDEYVFKATILVSKSPFSADEIQNLGKICRDENLLPLTLPGSDSRDPYIKNLLDPETRQVAVDASPFDISPPTDLKPYFFLQFRPRDVFSLWGKEFSLATEITYNGIRIMAILGVASILLTLLVVTLTVFGLPGKVTSSGGAYRWMTVYFLGIGLGYIFIQLGLHQRMILLLGHPTFALSVVLFSMLLGTGCGSLLTDRLFPTVDLRKAARPVLLAVCAVNAVVPLLGFVEGVSSEFGRISIVSVVMFAVGFFLGFALPLGVRVVAPTGEWAIQKMWAINGAASIAGSVLAAVIGVAFGSNVVLAVGLVCYAAAFLGGVMAQRAAEPAAS